MVCEQASAPPLHVVVPAAQTPCLPVEHATPLPGLPLSTTPSQSSSLPLHVSAPVCTVCTQTTAPLAHAVVPAAHTPSLPVAHATAPPGLPLSTAPSQSSSLPLHASVAGNTAPLHAPHWPAAQT